MFRATHSHTSWSTAAILEHVTRQLCQLRPELNQMKPDSDVNCPTETVLTLHVQSTLCGLKCVSVCLTLWMFFTLGGASSLSFFMALTGVSLKYGGSPSTISTTMMPRDQMST